MTDQTKSKKRAKLTGITLNIEYPDGTTRVVTVDPTLTTGLFWSDETVLQIFAPFYDNVQSEMTKEEFVNRFGDEAKTIIGNDSKIKVTRNVVEELWNLEDSKGFYRAMLGKTTDCLPR